MPDANPSTKRQPPDSYGDSVTIRTACVESDLSHVQRLFESGLLDGRLPDGDLGADIDNLRTAYLQTEAGGSNFWVAVLRDGDDRELLIGTIGVQRVNDDTAEVRRLRVDPGHRERGVGGRLMEHALSFCRDRGYLKVILDTRIDRAPAIALFERFGFQLNRSREVRGKLLLDFYLDLYRDPNTPRA